MNEEKTNLEQAEDVFGADETKQKKWSYFVESDAVNFFTGYKLEKMSIEDGNGNKAKFSRTKNNEIKVEYTSSVLL